MDWKQILLVGGGGAVIAAVVILATGFLREAGKDAYKLLKKKLFPNSIHEHSPQVVVQLAQNNTKLETTPSLTPAHVDRISHVTLQGISEAIKKVPPLQKNHVAATFVGLNVEWDAYFSSAQQLSDDLYKLRLAYDRERPYPEISCNVRLSDYRELATLEEGAKLQLYGKISSAHGWGVELEDVRLSFYADT